MFAFDPVPLANESSFLLEARFDQGDVPTVLTFSGVAPDQTRFETKNFHLERCGLEEDDTGTRLKLGGVCLTGTFRRPLATPAALPSLLLHLRGYRSFDQHEIACQLGRVIIGVHSKPDDVNTLSGSIALQAATPPDDFAKWRKDGETLLEHVRRVMSFASATLLRTPATDCYAGGEVEVQVRSQTMQSTGALPTIHHMQQEAIFATAVSSFFNPPVAVRQLFYAIEWFTMETTYNEIRLVCAMTALENLVNANLNEQDVLIEDRRVFDKTRRALRSVIRKCLEKWPVEQADVLSELNEKLADLNRRSLFRKVKILATRWHVPLDDTPDERLNTAIDARNRVVHRGQYYEERGEEDPDLWTHVTIIREVVARFLFTAIGYRGDYISYVGRAHHAKFPPTEEAG